MKQIIICPYCESNNTLVQFWDNDFICLNCGEDLKEIINPK